ncbi:MAG: CinA family protein [Oscillospiraceae bacterium]|nr:CinA family protein [Oscillospiraceae bacterium]
MTVYNDTAAKVMDILINKKITISVMESCTSGLIASMITDTEGASAVFEGGYVTYSNRVKEKAGVDGGIIQKYGVYSAECAQAMAESVQKALGSDIAVGITGTTGNTDPQNTGSVAGEAFFCVIYGNVPHGFSIKADVTGMCRHDIKQMYADKVFSELYLLLSTG